jgi:hypothetical protein
MSVERGFDSSDPVRGNGIGRLHEERRTRTEVMGMGTLACPHCDAPVSLGPIPLRPGEPIRCPYCFHVASVRDFLSLATPTRPAYVEVVVRVPRLPSSS